MIYSCKRKNKTSKKIGLLFLKVDVSLKYLEMSLRLNKWLLKKIAMLSSRNHLKKGAINFLNKLKN